MRPSPPPLCKDVSNAGGPDAAGTGRPHGPRPGTHFTRAKRLVQPAGAHVPAGHQGQRARGGDPGQAQHGVLCLHPGGRIRVSEAPLRCVWPAATWTAPVARSRPWEGGNTTRAAARPCLPCRCRPAHTSRWCLQGHAPPALPACQLTRRQLSRRDRLQGEASSQVRAARLRPKAKATHNPQAQCTSSARSCTPQLLQFARPCWRCPPPPACSPTAVPPPLLLAPSPRVTV